MLFSFLKVEVRGWKVVAKVGTVVHREVGSPWGPPLIWVLLAF
jgi:hypothetical protein